MGEVSQGQGSDVIAEVSTAPVSPKGLEVVFLVDFGKLLFTTIKLLYWYW